MQGPEEVGDHVLAVGPGALLVERARLLVAAPGDGHLPFWVAAVRAGAELLSVEHAGHAETGRQHGLDAVVSDWVLVLDADERLIGGVAALKKVLAAAPDEVAGFLLSRVRLCGRARCLWA